MNLAAIMVTKESMMLRANCPCFQFPMPVTRNLSVFAGIFSVSMSLLHLIVPPLKLMGLVIVTVSMMKEPLLKISCTSTCVRFSFRVFVVLSKEKGLETSPVRSLIFQLKIPVH